MNKQDFQNLCNALTQQLSLPPITVELKNTQRGRARTKTNKITIPKFAIGFGKAFCVYYIIHEVCHFLQRGHGSKFKLIETEILKSYDLIPIYSRAYAKKLYDLNNNLLWSRKGRK